jgi:lipoprotein-releasing system permease protein
MKWLEWFIARRYLASRKKGRFLSLITLIAVGGVGLGVMALITVIAVMTGLQTDLQSKILGSNPHIYVFELGASRGFRLGDWRRVTARVSNVPGVVSAEPFIMTNVAAIVGQGDYVMPGRLFGIDPQSASEPLTVVERDIRDGKLSFGPTQTGLPGLILGVDLAKSLNVLPGDSITIASFENIHMDPVTAYPTPVVRTFEVANTIRTGMYEYDNQNMYVELSVAQDLLGLTADTVSGVAANVVDAYDAATVAASIDDELKSPYYTNTWIQLNSSLFSALKLEKLAMALILFMIVLVAAFNIVSTLIMVVTDKTREIGILKSMGLTNRGVLRVFILQGVTIGLIGTALGALGGIGLVFALDRGGLIKLPADVYFVDTLPVKLDGLDFLLIVLVSVVIAFVATIYPARQASKLLPVEAIRHD